MDAINERTQRLFFAARDNFNLDHSCHINATDFTKPGNNFDKAYMQASILYYAKTAKAAAQDSSTIVDQAIAHHETVSASHPSSPAASQALKVVIDAKFYAKHAHKKAKETCKLLPLK